LQRALALLEAKNVAGHRPHFLGLLAQVQVREGDFQSALALCSDAQEGARRTEQHYFDAEIYRIEGEARRAAGHPLTDVERSLSTALEVSRQQGARMFELRAATALARLMA
jgi:predicted ATPase